MLRGREKQNGKQNKIQKHDKSAVVVVGDGKTSKKFRNIQYSEFRVPLTENYRCRCPAKRSRADDNNQQHDTRCRSLLAPCHYPSSSLEE